MSRQDGGTRRGPVSLAWGVPPAEPIEPDGLSAGDAARASGLTGGRRSQFFLGRLLASQLVGDLFPQESGWWLSAEMCPRCWRAHGRVEVHGVLAVASISHTSGLTVAAVAPAATVGRIGVDVEAEALGADRVREVAALLRCPPGQALRRWTRTEAVLKADGRGLTLDPAAVRLGRGLAVVPDDPGDYRLADVPGPAGFRISVAWRGAAASAAAAGPAKR